MPCRIYKLDFQEKKYSVFYMTTTSEYGTDTEWHIVI